MDLKQAGDRYAKMTREEKDHLIGNIVQSMMFLDEGIQKKVVGHLKQANQEMGSRVERELFLEL